MFMHQKLITQLKYLNCFLIVSTVLWILGIVDKVFELSLEDKHMHLIFSCDLEESRMKEKNGDVPNIEGIRLHQFEYLHNASNVCFGKHPQLLYVVKSYIVHKEQRMVIRQTWGYTRRFSDVHIQTVFLLGMPPDKNSADIDLESALYKDIVQANFHDSYSNITIKVWLGLKWVVRFCPTARFIVFVDDDYYVSTKNMLRFIRNPQNYPAYLQQPYTSVTEFIDQPHPVKQFELYAGYVFSAASVKRMRFSKWYISLKDYPFNQWPPYVTGGTVVLSQTVVLDMYYASHCTKYLPFDDVYFGFMALLVQVPPLHNEEFHFWHKVYKRYNYKYVISSHGFSNPEVLMKIWNEQLSLGNA